MSKMTSSIHADSLLARRRLQATAAAAAKQAQQAARRPLDSDEKRRAVCNGAGSKALTDFSIDSIIGHAQTAQCDQITRQRSPSHNPDSPTRDTFRPNGDAQAKEFAADNLHTQDFNSQQSNMHKKERPKHFQCAWCPFKFSNNGQLRNHERIHTGERPFRCDQLECGRTFTRNEELTRHKLIHSGTRPHICRHCEKRFGRKDHLKKHERTHERKKSSRRSQAAKTAVAQQNPSRHQDLNLFLPMKLDYQCVQPAPLPIPPCYHIPAPIHPAPDQTDIFYRPHNPLRLNVSPNDLLTNEIVSLARAATTNTSTTQSGVPIMGASLEATQAIMTSASNAMQQFATTYLHRWFNAVGQQNSL